MVADIFFLALGLVLITKGGDLFVESSVKIAACLHVPRILIGGTLVSIGTTMPELVVSVTASWLGDSGIAIGNAVGSVIANIGLVGGSVVVMSVVVVEQADFRARSWWMIGSSLLVILFCWNGKLERTAAVGLFLLSLFYLYVDYLKGQKHRARSAAGMPEPVLQGRSLGRSFVIFTVGTAMVFLGSRLLVISAIGLATAFGIPSVIIGLSIVAVGTSLPELVTGITSARKGVADLSVGNIVGSNVINLAMIVGLSGIVRPLTLSRFTQLYSFPWLLIFVFVMVFTVGRTGKISRKVGAVFLLLYGLYLTGLVIVSMLGRTG